MNLQQNSPADKMGSEVKGGVSTLHELARFTEALDEYKQEVLPSRRSKGRSSGSSSKVTPARKASAHPLPQKPSSTVHPTYIHTSAYSDTVSTESSVFSNSSVRFPCSTSVSLLEATSMSGPIPDIDITFPAGDRREATEEHSNTRNNYRPNAQTGGAPSFSILKGHPRLPERFIIGRHVIEFTATNFYLNGQEITFVSAYDCALANKFLSALKESSDKLDELDSFLRGRGPEGPWTRIPGWTIG